MSDFTKRAALIVLILVAVLFLVFSDFGNTDRIVRYDCRDAHWHPDIPIEVKQACQRLFYEHWKYLQEQEQKKKTI